MPSRTSKQLNPGWLKVSSEAQKGQASCDKKKLSVTAPAKPVQAQHRTSGEISAPLKFSPQIIQNINPLSAARAPSRKIMICNFFFQYSILNTLKS